MAAYYGDSGILRNTFRLHRIAIAYSDRTVQPRSPWHDKSLHRRPCFPISRLAPIAEIVRPRLSFLVRCLESVRDCWLDRNDKHSATPSKASCGPPWLFLPPGHHKKIITSSTPLDNPPHLCIPDVSPPSSAPAPRTNPVQFQIFPWPHHGLNECSGASFRVASCRLPEKAPSSQK
jgi:hypothetical protein